FAPADGAVVPPGASAGLPTRDLPGRLDPGQGCLLRRTVDHDIERQTMRNGLFILGAVTAAVWHLLWAPVRWAPRFRAYRSGHGRHMDGGRNLMELVELSWWPNDRYQVYTVTPHEVVLSRAFDPERYGRHAQGGHV